MPSHNGVFHRHKPRSRSRNGPVATIRTNAGSHFSPRIEGSSPRLTRGTHDTIWALSNFVTPKDVWICADHARSDRWLRAADNRAERYELPPARYARGGPSGKTAASAETYRNWKCPHPHHGNSRSTDVV